MNEINDDPRPIFNVLDSEKAEQVAFDSRIARAADKAATQVDFETIAMFRRRGLPLPPRLAKLATQTDYDFKGGAPIPLAKSATPPKTVKELRKADTGRNYTPTYSVRYEQDLVARGVK